MSKVKVVAVEPLKKPYEAEMTFEEMQSFVGGYIRSVSIYDDKSALLNEDGVQLKLEPNRHMILQDKGHMPLQVLGNFVVVKSENGEFVDMDRKELDEALFIFRSESADATVFI